MRISDWSSDVCPSDLIACTRTGAGNRYLLQRHGCYRPVAAMAREWTSFPRPYRAVGDNPIFFAHHAGILGSDACAGRLVRRSAVSSVAGEADFARTDVRAGAVVDADFATRCDGRSEEHTSELHVLMR